MTVPARLSFVTLGVRDLAAMRAFYEGLGWPLKFTTDDFASFQLGGVVLALYPIDQLASDAVTDPDEATGWSGWTLACNVETREQVDETWLAFVDAGATPVARPVDHPYGPRSGYVADPEGNRWEIAYADGVTFGPNGEVRP